MGWLIRFIALYVLGNRLAGFLFLPNALSILTLSRMSVSHYVSAALSSEYYQQFLASFVFNNCGYTYGIFVNGTFEHVSAFMKRKPASEDRNGASWLFWQFHYVGHVLNSLLMYQTAGASGVSGGADFC
ncbi:MAG: hypothetical protein ACLTN0_03210 [Coprococcus phoceensis]